MDSTENEEIGSSTDDVVEPNKGDAEAAISSTESAVTNQNSSQKMEIDDVSTTEEAKTNENVNVSSSEVSTEQSLKRKIVENVITISDTDSDDSSVCHVDSYQASAAEAKRLRGVSDYDSSSDSYSSDEESPSDDTIILDYKNITSKLTQHIATLQQRAPRLEDPKLNESYKDENLMKDFLTHWKDKKAMQRGNVTILPDPFRVCILDNFFSNTDIINNIVDDMNTLDWSRRKMDLYEFYQTTDLSNFSWQRSIKNVYDLLKADMMPWVSKITGIKLTHVSASCSLYGPSDYLLVHDDLLSDRRVAFILYLAPWNVNTSEEDTSDTVAGEENGQSDSKESETGTKELKRVQKGWTEEMGGALELLGIDDKNQPADCVRRILPNNNTLVFFKVGSDSFHQVAEVTSLDFPRLSINGWFHGPDEDEEETEREDPEKTLPVDNKFHSEVVLMNQWLDATYLIARNRLKIQLQIEKESEISLENFFKTEMYEEVLKSLQTDELILWQRHGPPDQRKYDMVKLEELELLPREHPVRSLIKIVTSKVFFKFLQECTELSLETYSRLELQRWSATSFTVLPPKTLYAQNELDITMYLGCPDYAFSGGCTTYLAPEDAGSDPLITLEPRNNALSIVYSDDGTASFTKYVSKLTFKPADCFYMLKCSYKE